MQPDLSKRVVKHLAAYFHLPLANIAMPGTTLIPDAERGAGSWMTLWPVGQRIVMQVGTELLPELQQMLANCPSGHCLTRTDLQRRWPDVIIETEKVYFLHPKDCTQPSQDSRFTIRQLQEADAPAFNAFLERCGPEDIEQGEVALEHETVFGVLDGERIVAGASAFEWYGFKDIGVITDPEYRRMGLGKAVVAAICAHYSTLTDVILYRHLTTNTGSQHIAEALGFQLYATVDSIRRKAI